MLQVKGFADESCGGIELRWDPTTKIVVPPGTEFCTRVRERLRGGKMQKITNLHETFASLDNSSKSGVMR